MTEALIIGIVGSLLASAIWYYVSRLIRGRQSPDMSANYPDYSGRWYGVHVTKKGDNRTSALSHHVYDIVVDKKGRIKGKMIDKIASPPWELNLTGFFSGNNMVLVLSGGPFQGHFGTQYHAEVKPNAINFGIVASIDSNNNPFSAPIAFSRQPVTETDLEAAIAKLKGNYYTKMPSRSMAT